MVCINGQKKWGREKTEHFRTSNRFFSKATQTGDKKGEKKYLATTAQFVTFTKQPTKKSLQVRSGWQNFYYHEYKDRLQILKISYAHTHTKKMQ